MGAAQLPAVKENFWLQAPCHRPPVSCLQAFYSSIPNPAKLREKILQNFSDELVWINLDLSSGFFNPVLLNYYIVSKLPRHIIAEILNIAQCHSIVPDDAGSPPFSLVGSREPILLLVFSTPSASKATAAVIPRSLLELYFFFRAVSNASPHL